MARCTLDDLVPSVRCNRIFLESLNGGYSEYEVQIEASVYDKVEDEDGIADYLLTDTFKDNIQVLFVFSRDEGVKQFLDFLDLSGISSPLKSFIFTFVVGSSASGESIYQAFVDTSIFQNTSEAIVRTTAFRNAFVQRLEQLKASDKGYKYIDFSGYSNDLIDRLGERRLDENGDIEYDLMIPREDLRFTNTTSVNDSYLHMVSYFNVSREEVEIPLTVDTLPFFFKDVDECHILSDGLPASANVQDFRQSERIAEIIRPDRITIFDQVIDNVSLVSGKEVSQNGITSELYSAYNTRKTGNKLYTKNIFFLNIHELVRRNTEYRFIYDNLRALGDSFEFDSSIIQSIKIYRHRKDVQEDRVPLLYVPTLLDGEITKDVFGFEFYDNSFGDLTYGKYTYEAEVKVTDPVQNIMEDSIHKTKVMISKYSSAIDYIHNNPQVYNEMRDSISSSGKSDISSILGLGTEEYDTNMSGFGMLFLALTGLNPLAYAIILSQEFIELERRKLENTLRIMQDIVSAAGKFFEVDAINHSSANSSQSPKEHILYSRIWNSLDLTPENQDDIILTGFGNIEYMSEFKYRRNMEYEISSHDQTVADSYASNPSNFGCISPLGISTMLMYQEDGTVNEQAFLKIMKRVFRESNSGVEENQLLESIYSNDDQPYTSTISDLKNNSGMFESFMHNLGATVENVTLGEVNTTPRVSREAKRKSSKGIDDGENLFGVKKKSTYGALSQFGDEDSETLDEKREEIKQTIMLEKAKKEDLIMRALLDRKGYAALDRKSHTQGDSLGRNFEFNFNFKQRVEDQNISFPAVFYSGSKYFGLSRNGNGDKTKMPFARFIMDNMFMIYYLEGYDENMNARWRHLTDMEAVRNLINSNEYGLNRIVCKMKRFQNSDVHIGQGSTSDMEIMSKYFYLYLN